MARRPPAAVIGLRGRVLLGLLSRAGPAIDPTRRRCGRNEAGMLLGGEIRAADAAVWRAADATPRIGRLRDRAPVLAVEVAGEDESESELRSKARWYLDHGAVVVWILLPRTFELLAIDGAGERRLAKDERLPARAELPDLSPQVAELFAQLLRSG